MCILMYFAPGAQPDADHLKYGCENNPDGFGWAIVPNGYRSRDAILTGHSMNPDIAIEEFITARADQSENAAIFHARITTDGGTVLDNCHPFKVNGRPSMVLGHNGIINNCRPSAGDRRSDTRILAEDVIWQRFRRLDRPKTATAVEEFIGSGSKVVILTTDMRFKYQSYLFNERAGTWIDQGRWYSNGSHVKRSYGYRSYGFGESWITSRPRTTIGYPTEGVASDGKAYANSFEGYEWVCGECGWDIEWCRCVGTRRQLLVPSSQAKSISTATEEELDDLIEAGAFERPAALALPSAEIDWSVPATWRCMGCGRRGTINTNTCQCESCGFMWCCDSPESECQCSSAKPSTSDVPSDLPGL